MLAWTAILLALIWTSYKRRAKQYFYITETQAGFGSPKNDECPCDFDQVRDYHEDQEHISITHDSISVPLGLELHRNRFTPTNWEIVRSALTERIERLPFKPNEDLRTRSSHSSSFAADHRFPCKRNPTFTDFLWGIFMVTTAVSQSLLAIKKGGQWLVFLPIWPVFAWTQVGLIRGRLRADLIIGPMSIKFEKSPKFSENVLYEEIQDAKVDPYYIKIRHTSGVTPFKKSLLLSHTYFTPEDWSQIQELTLVRLQKAGILIHRLKA